MLRNNIFSNLLLGVICIVFMCCIEDDRPVVIDFNDLASQYFHEDAQWYIDNIPFFECSDKQIEEVYYYRWKLYKAHIRNVGESGFVITEFIDNVNWDRDPFGSINAASMHHIYEGRWLKDNRYLDGYIDYLYEGGGNNRRYSEGIADASYARYLVNADSAFIISQLPFMQKVYEEWSDHYDTTKNLYYNLPGYDATEYSISAIDASGGNKDSWGGESYRPTINSYMYCNALAISRIVALKGDSVLSRVYLNKAAELKASVQNNLWNDSLHYFTDRYKVDNKFVNNWDFIRGRELAGVVPWSYNLPDDTSKYNSVWTHVIDTTGLLGKYGLRTNEPSYEHYMAHFRVKKNGELGCQWNGPSWPFQTSQALAGIANLLNHYTQKIIQPSDYLKILRLYAAQHYCQDGEKMILNLQEDYNPDTGKPIAFQRSYGSDHYNHSCFNDLIITGLCGLRPSKGDTLIINPIVDNSIRYFSISDILYHGHLITIVYDKDGRRYKRGKGLHVLVNGKKTCFELINGKYQIEIPPPEIPHEYKPELNLALNIRGSGFPKPNASVNSVPDSLYQAIDGRIWYFPEVKNRWSTLGSTSSTDWYALDFGKLHKVSSVKIYLYADGKIFSTPDDYTIEYWNEDHWLPIKEKSRNPSKPIENTVNTVLFDEVVTDQIKVNFRKGSNILSVALTELECY